MKIQSSTFLLVLTALLLGGVTLLVVQNSPSSQPSEQTASAEQTDLFGFEEKQVQMLSVTTPIRSLKFERDKEGKWQMIEPEKTPASDASIAFLLDLMTSGKSERTFTAPASDREKYGFHQPFGTVEVKLDNQESHKLILGEYDFNRSFIYASTDPSAEPNAELKVSLVSPSFENAVNRSLIEWRQAAESFPSPAPAKGASPSPSPSPAESPSSSASPSPSPSPAASPAPSPAASSPSPSP
ncbi:MAG TPA: DUF4340 domain-containing protein [Trichocoleus sp.]|jgi:hypothetical protein